MFTVAASELFPGSTADDWHRLLQRSIREPVVDGVEMPRFPHGSVQRGFVGSADENTLHEAWNFWRYVKDVCAELGRPIDKSTRFLDFGSAWGRYTRFFWYDIAPGNLHGVDIDPEIVATCRYLGVPGDFRVIDPKGRLPYEDGSFDLVIAYSVFTHLPERVATHWMTELSRVTSEGGVIVYTVEPRRFLTFIETLDPQSPNMWHALMATFKERIPGLLKDFDEGRYCYIPTSGGAYRDADVYGDAAISRQYIETSWADLFRLVSYLDDPARFWQAVVAAQK